MYFLNNTLIWLIMYHQHLEIYNIKYESRIMHRICFIFWRKKICIYGSYGSYSLFSYSIIYVILFYCRDIKNEYVILLNNLVKNFNINVMQSINIYARKFHSLWFKLFTVNIWCNPTSHGTYICTFVLIKIRLKKSRLAKHYFV